MFRCLVVFMSIMCSVMGASGVNITRSLCKNYDSNEFMRPEEDMVHLFVLNKTGEPEAYFGLKDKYGKTVRDAVYRGAIEQSQLGLYILKDKNGLYGCILSNNETAVDFKYKSIRFKYTGNKNVIFTCITPDGQIETKSIKIQDKPWRERYYLLEEKYSGNLFDLSRAELRKETERTIALSNYKPDYIF